MDEKLEKLKKILLDMDSVLVAYSGGVDSTLLLKVASDTLGKKVLSVIAKSETYPKDELEFAKEMSNSLNVETIIIETEEFKDERFLSNPKERCYYCKFELFSKLKKIAKERNIKYVVDGSNFDDRKDYRPGNRAKKELGIRSPLEEAHLRKTEIRQLSKKLGLTTWDKPSFACLASRIPYGDRITKGKIKMVEEAEKYIRELGFKEVRVRHHGEIARIEVPKDSVQLFLNEETMDSVSRKLREIGFFFVTLDLKGLRTGSLNEVLGEIL